MVKKDLFEGAVGSALKPLNRIQPYFFFYIDSR